MNMQDQKYPQQKTQQSNSPLVLPLSAIDASQLSLVGGKAANLGELMRAGLPVPEGFCVTTAAYELVSQQADLEELLHELATTDASDIKHLEQYTATIRDRLRAITIPPDLVEALRDAYQQLTHNAPFSVAVRSSATAEDLPFASFAGQQDTILNVITFDSLLDAVRRCWASLWNDRAVSYRASNGIDARTVHLAVVVQRMINATVAGVLFTANPLTGRRHQAVIDANPGLGEMEARSGPVFQQLASDPRLTPIPTSRWIVIRKILSLLVRARARPLLLLVQALLNPKAARANQEHVQEQLRSWGQLPPHATPRKLLTAIEQTVLVKFPSIMFNIMPILFLVFGLPAIAKRLLKGLATEDEIQVVRRGLLYNPTTEMNLKLWQLAQRLREEPAISALFHDNQPAQLAQAYRAESLSPLLQQGLADFLSLYGHRGVAEIDMGLPRWSEDPTYLFGMLANYIQLNDPDAAPDLQFQRSVQEAEAMVQTLIRRARRRGWLRGQLTGFCLHRIRALSGLREVPKFGFVLLMAGAHRYLFAIGEELAHSQRLEDAEDIFFITLKETHEALAGQDMRTLVQERRADYERELGRRHIPRIMLSDGTEPEAAMTLEQGNATDGMLKGAAASAGVVSGKARVILDPTGAHLEPGEILVAPSTDPGWTPLFFTASGLVMEMGGPMSHGAIVAREYGIPAVVGVAGALDQISTGQQITVDGSRGIITIT